MHQDWPGLAAGLSGPLKELRGGAAEVMKGFGGLARAALEAKALDTKTKELIALALGVSQKCDGCIATHARAAARAGATEQEVAEAIGVTILLDGGPGTVYGPRAFAAFKEFQEYFASRQ